MNWIRKTGLALLISLVVWILFSWPLALHLQTAIPSSSRNIEVGQTRAMIPGDHILHIPMRAGNRSLNLANAVSVVVYEAWRQRGFEGASTDREGVTQETMDSPHFDP